MKAASFWLLALTMTQPALAAPAGEMDKAFLAAFSHPAPFTILAGSSGAKKLVKFTYGASGLVNIAPGMVALISTGKAADCDHCSGALAINYLKHGAQGYSLVKAWLVLHPSASDGSASAWALRDDIDSVPIIMVSDAEGGRECRQTFMQMIALMPDHPVVQAKLLLSALSDPGPEPDHSPGYRVTAKIVPEERGKRFALDYSGTWKLHVEYVRRGDTYAAKGEEAPSCN